MLGEFEYIYREEQRFGLWLRRLIAVSMAVAVVFSIFSLTKVSPEQGSGDAAEIVTVVIAGIVIPIGVALLFGMLRLETEVRSDGLYVRFFPFHINFKRFGAEDLSEYYARQYNPLREYGGWGIRCSLKKGRAYNVSGNKGVQLVFKDGKQLLIGSQRADELEEALRSIMGGSK